MTVTVPKGHSLEAAQILTDSDEKRFINIKGQTELVAFELDPLVQKLYLEMTPPSISDYTAAHERLYLAIREKSDA